MMKDSYHSLKTVSGLKNLVVNNDTEGIGAIVDLALVTSALLTVNVGESGDTLSGAVAINLTVKHGNVSDGSDFVVVPEKDLLGAIAGTTTGSFGFIDDPAEDGKVFQCGYRGSKRYVQFVADITGTHTNGTPIAAQWVLGGHWHEPVSLA